MFVIASHSLGRLIYRGGKLCLIHLLSPTLVHPLISPPVRISTLTDKLTKDPALLVQMQTAHRRLSDVRPTEISICSLCLVRNLFLEITGTLPDPLASTSALAVLSRLAIFTKLPPSPLRLNHKCKKQLVKRLLADSGPPAQLVQQ